VAVSAGDLLRRRLSSRWRVALARKDAEMGDLERRP
jgi:hypothetical protein